MPAGDQRPTGPSADFFRYSGLGLGFAATVGVFGLVGYWLDARLGSGPWILIAGVFLGFALGLFSMVKKLPARSSDSPSRPSEEDNR
jgi:F0F1-type ATP synthase assembly protein I